MVEVEATLVRTVWSSIKCLLAVAKGSRNGRFSEAVEGEIVFADVPAVTQMWTGCRSSICADRLEVPSRLVHAPGAAPLNGKAQPLLAVRHRPDKPVLTDKAERLWSTTELRNTNANMLLWYSSIMFTTEI